MPEWSRPSEPSATGVDLLGGLRVVDFTHVHAGPLCAYQLALMGADIIKVESPSGGDQLRRGHPEGVPPAFLGQNANKRSLAIDLKHPDGLQAVHTLIATADVVLHNMRPGTPDRLGIGYETVRGIKSDIVYCAVSGYGQSGPESDRPAYDHLIQGESGMFMATGTEEQPVRVGFAIADSGTAVIASSAILGALLRRERTGEGAFIDVSMLESSMTLMGLNYYNFLATGRPQRRVGPNPLAQAGSSGTFETKDGTLLVSALTHRQFQRLAKALGREDLLADERFGTEDAARVNRAELRRVFAAHYRADTAAHWEQIIRAAGVPCGQLKGPERALENPQLAFRGTVRELADVPGVADGTLRFLGTGFTVDSQPAMPTRPPPRLGEHSVEILTELGYDDDAIAVFRGARNDRVSRVVVVGGGNAALNAATAAREGGAQVVLLERAPFELRGGNSRFTAGAMRTVYNGVDDLRRLMPELTPGEIDRTDFGSYSREQFYDDMGRVTQYRTDPELAEKLIETSFDTLCWMREKGVRFLPLYGRQSFEVGPGTATKRVRFWGGLTVEAWGGGPGLVDSLSDVATKAGVDIRYGCRATGLRRRSRGFDVLVDAEAVSADAVVVACGGFEANPAWRTRYLGPGWDLAKVRGTRFNTGDGIRMAVDIGAATRGNWSGCHAVGWDMNAPEFGDLDVGDNFQKHSYPFGVLVNSRGRRFVDEGEDFRNYTYARYGREVLNQPGQCAWQIFDAKVTHLLRDEYRIRRVTKVTADTLAGLAAKMEGVDAPALVEEIARFNAAVDVATPFDPTVKDGRGTVGLTIRKSNWANRLDTPPFEAYGITCGITFTFGGLAVDSEARVLSEEGAPIPGLFAAGELVGGLFYFNYPGGTGLTSGAVFGRTAGRNAASGG